MSKLLNRSEILFLYDIENNNPNGDPINENRPRFDTEDGRILVTDVRLKRTIRDFWFEYKGYDGQDGKDVFVRETTYTEGEKEFVKDGKRRAKDFSESREKVLEQCIDVRVFGGVLPLQNDSITLTGPVQFQMGKSLHASAIDTIEGTGAFASTGGKSQKSIRTEYKTPYTLVGFNGIVNEKAAAYSGMSEDDKALLLEGIWEGTRSLISRSKVGQLPRLLITIEYKPGSPFYIGALRQKIHLIPQEGKSELQIRGPKDYVLDLAELCEAIKQHAAKIQEIKVQVDSALRFTNGAAQIKLFTKNYSPDEFCQNAGI